MNQPFKQLEYCSKVSWQSVVSLDSWHKSCFSIPARIENQELRIKNKLLRIESRIKSCRTENKRLTQDWFLANFTKTYSCDTTQHGYICASSCMRGKKTNSSCKANISSRTFVSSFISSSKVSSACSKCKQCIFVHKPWGDLDACQKFWIKPLKETNLGVGPPLFYP